MEEIIIGSKKLWNSLRKDLNTALNKEEGTTNLNLELDIMLHYLAVMILNFEKASQINYEILISEVVQILKIKCESLKEEFKNAERIH